MARLHPSSSLLPRAAVGTVDRARGLGGLGPALPAGAGHGWRRAAWAMPPFQRPSAKKSPCKGIRLRCWVPRPAVCTLFRLKAPSVSSPSGSCSCFNDGGIPERCFWCKERRPEVLDTAGPWLRALVTPSTRLSPHGTLKGSLGWDTPMFAGCQASCWDRHRITGKQGWDCGRIDPD